MLSLVTGSATARTATLRLLLRATTGFWARGVASATWLLTACMIVSLQANLGVPGRNQAATSAQKCSQFTPLCPGVAGQGVRLDNMLPRGHPWDMVSWCEGLLKVNSPLLLLKLTMRS